MSKEDLEVRLQRLEDHQDILQTLIDYAELVDACDFDAWRDLWMEDGELELATGLRVKGRAAILETLQEVIRTTPYIVRHMEMNPRISIDGDTATSTMLYGVIRTEHDGFSRVVWSGHRFTDHVRTAAGWKIQSRRNTVELPETGHPNAPKTNRTPSGVDEPVA
ncbi:MAG TPA: nuclear transport factor 2 family protein [Sphingobium sp.]